MVTALADDLVQVQIRAELFTVSRVVQTDAALAQALPRPVGLAEASVERVLFQVDLVGPVVDAAVNDQL